MWLIVCLTLSLYCPTIPRHCQWDDRIVSSCDRVPQGLRVSAGDAGACGRDLDEDIILDAVSHGSPLGNLAAAMKVAGLSRVDAWIGTGGEAGGPVIRPKTYVPITGTDCSAATNSC